MPFQKLMVVMPILSSNGILPRLAAGTSAALFTIAACLIPLGATAQEAANPQAASAGVRVELNRLEPRGEACRTYLLLENKGNTDYKSLRLDLFVLDKGGVISQRLAVETAPLEPKKTSIKLFDFPATSCEDFGRVLLNGVISCEANGTKRDDCLRAIETSSKAPVPFTK